MAGAEVLEQRAGAEPDGDGEQADEEDLCRCDGDCEVGEGEGCGDCEGTEEAGRVYFC